MRYIVAFKHENQSYILPLSGQPKYLFNSDVKDDVTWVDEIKDMQEKCNKSSLLSCPMSRQKIYLWWMGLSLEQRAEVIDRR